MKRSQARLVLRSTFLFYFFRGGEGGGAFSPVYSFRQVQGEFRVFAAFSLHSKACFPHDASVVRRSRQQRKQNIEQLFSLSAYETKCKK